MKNYLSNFKFLAVSIFVLSFLFVPKVNATMAYSTYNIPYVVTGGPSTECSDTVDNSDPEDSLADTNDPGCHTDGNASNPASYDANDNNETNAGGPSGTLTAGNCTIATGGATCASTVGWVTSNLTGNPTSITRNVGSPASFTPSPLAVGSQGVTLNYGNTVFTLIHNSATLDQKTGVASCTSGTSWDGDSCEVGGGPINGMCGAAHWACIQGTSTNQVTGSNKWTWTCLGSGGGSSDFCEELFGGSYECSDGIDNDGDKAIDFGSDPECSSPTDNSEAGAGGGTECSDGVDNSDVEDSLADAQDPGCHTDGNASNPASYDSNDDNETNKRKPIFIEF